jgi:hypothetical protein
MLHPAIAFMWMIDFRGADPSKESLRADYSMLRHIQRNRQQDIARLVDDLKVPAVPVDLVGFAFLPQFLNGFERLIMGCFEIRDFNSGLVDDSFVRVHKVKVTVHDWATLEIFTHRRASTRPGICR